MKVETKLQEVIKLLEKLEEEKWKEVMFLKEHNFKVEELSKRNERDIICNILRRVEALKK